MPSADTTKRAPTRTPNNHDFNRCMNCGDVGGRHTEWCKGRHESDDRGTEDVRLRCKKCGLLDSGVERDGSQLCWCPDEVE